MKTYEDLVARLRNKRGGFIICHDFMKEQRIMKMMLCVSMKVLGYKTPPAGTSAPMDGILIVGPDWIDIVECASLVTFQERHPDCWPLAQLSCTALMAAVGDLIGERSKEHDIQMADMKELPAELLKTFERT